MKPIVEMTQTELENTLLEYEVLKKENHANRWTAILAVIVIILLSIWVSGLEQKNNKLEVDKANLTAICEKQKEYFSTQLDTMVFYNECGIRINLSENE